MIYEADRTPPNGRCQVCGRKLTEPGRIRHCSRAHRRKSYFQGPWMKFARKSERIIEDWQPYIAERLKLPDDDPRLEEVVVALASNGKLHAYRGAHGTITAVGLPKATK